MTRIHHDGNGLSVELERIPLDLFTNYTKCSPNFIAISFLSCKTEQKMLRQAARTAIKRRSLVAVQQLQQQTLRRSLATQSGDDAKRPTALAKLHLEDGTTLIGKSFGSHEAAEGEVSLS